MPKSANVQFDPAVNINILKPHPENVNQGDYGAIEQSFNANGFYGSLVVNKRTMHILAGNHRYRVAKQMGFEKLPVSFVDVDPQEEIRIMLADNRTTRLGNDDESALVALLTRLENTTDLGLMGTGYDGDDLDEMIKMLGGSDETPDSFDEVGEDIPTNCECPKCGYKWSDGK